MSMSSSVIPENRFVSYRQYVLIIICFFLNIVDGFDITMIAVTIADIGKSLEIGEASQGIVFSFALAGMMIGAMVVAPVSDLIGRRVLLLLSLTTIVISVSCTPLSVNLSTLAFFRFLSGLGGGALLAAQATLVSEFSPEKYKTLCVTFVTAGYPIGAMTTGFVATLVIPEYGWHVMFYIGGALTLFLLVLSSTLLPESVEFLLIKQPKNADVKLKKILSDFNISNGPVHFESITRKNGLISNIQALFLPSNRKATLLLWLVFCSCSSTLYFLMSWIPKLATQIGFEQSVSYSAFSYFSFGGVCGILLLGFLSSRFEVVKLVGVFLFFSTLFMLLMAYGAENEVIFLFSIYFVGLTLQSAYNALYAVATRLYPAAVRSTGVGWAIGIGRLGAVIAPAVAGVLLANGTGASSSIGLFSLPILISSFAAFLIMIETK